MPLQLEHEELTGQIRQVAFEAHRYFGDGFPEKVYENSLCRRLHKAGLKVEQQVPILVRDEDGTVVGEYFSDLLVEGFLIIEIKAVKTLSSQHQAQIIHDASPVDSTDARACTGEGACATSINIWQGICGTAALGCAMLSQPGKHFSLFGVFGVFGG